jgi:rare lipoprotein A (peptidoglycan hydrolase)
MDGMHIEKTQEMTPHSSSPAVFLTLLLLLFLGLFAYDYLAKHGYISGHDSTAKYTVADSPVVQEQEKVVAPEVKDKAKVKGFPKIMFVPKVRDISRKQLLAEFYAYHKKQKQRLKVPIPQFTEGVVQGKKCYLHVVKEGETLEGLGRQFAANLDDIRRTNKLDGNVIVTGQTLAIPQFKCPVVVAKASCYGFEDGFDGKIMANGEPYNRYNITIAARDDLPRGLMVAVFNENRRDLGYQVAEVADWGPCHVQKKNGDYDRKYDMSIGLAILIGAFDEGVAKIRVVPLGSKFKYCNTTLFYHL